MLNKYSDNDPGLNNKKDFKMIKCFPNRLQKYLYINVSKNASTSIRKSIIFDGYEPYNSLESVDKYLKFMVVRNPFNRVISSYNEVKKLRRDGPWKITQRASWYQEPNLLKSFEMFLEFITGNFYDNHVKPQKIFLDDKGISLSDIDEILLMDNLEKDFNRLIKNHPQILTKSLSLRHELKTPSDTHHLLGDFIESSSAVRKQILSLYSEDFLIYKKVAEGR